ncbi:hypothetical protein FNV82_07325 [Chlorobium phaeovibrioides]|nr:hypothetical protein [Chlorobium phaeovibrioides]QEQ57377.1 hypothetical protein FNV82_07325 [Chlorobium phaeovibrioides]
MDFRAQPETTRQCRLSREARRKRTPDKKEGRRPTRLPHGIGRLYHLRNRLQTDEVMELIKPRSVTIVDEICRSKARGIDAEQIDGTLHIDIHIIGMNCIPVVVCGRIVIKADFRSIDICDDVIEIDCSALAVDQVLKVDPIIATGKVKNPCIDVDTVIGVQNGRNNLVIAATKEDKGSAIATWIKYAACNTIVVGRQHNQVITAASEHAVITAERNKDIIARSTVKPLGTLAGREEVVSRSAVEIVNLGGGFTDADDIIAVKTVDGIAGVIEFAKVTEALLPIATNRGGSS